MERKCSAALRDPQWRVCPQELNGMSQEASCSSLPLFFLWICPSSLFSSWHFPSTHLSRLKFHGVDLSAEKNAGFHMNEYIYKVLAESDISPLHLPNSKPPNKVLRSMLYIFFLWSLGPRKALKLALDSSYKIPEWSVYWPSFLNEWHLCSQLPKYLS